MVQKLLAGLLLAFLLPLSPLFSQECSRDYDVAFPDVIIAGTKTTMTLTVSGGTTLDEPLYLEINGKDYETPLKDGKATIDLEFDAGEQEVAIGALGYDHSVTINVLGIPLWMSILPPLLAILLALVFREVITSLFAGIFLGSAIIGVYIDGPVGIFTGLFRVVDTYLIGAMEDSGHLSVIIFSLTIGAVVAVISRNGGMLGVVNNVSKYAKKARSGQFATWLLGIGIFFDDYANTLVVGNTMRPVTDRLRISREKLSYIVDSTAAPIAAIAFVTTWIGAELGYIEDGISGLEYFQDKENGLQPYGIFMSSLAYSFYPILTLGFMLMLIGRNRDFGPMFSAEKRARLTGAVTREPVDASGSSELEALEPVDKSNARPFNAVLPILVIILGTLWGLWSTGYDADVWSNSDMGFGKKLSTTIGNADSYKALLWSSICGLILAIVLSVSQRILSLEKSVDAALAGVKTMLPAIVILVFAWALATVTEHLHTADFLVSVVEGQLSPWMLPGLIFVLSALTAFATGSSWGTMAILYPLVLPVTWALCLQSGMDPEAALGIFYNVVSVVLAGSVLGDHCSPISDTTILSSLASQCNHIDHVRTQLPYALTVGGVALFLCTVPAAFGVPSWLLFILGLGALYGVVHFFGREVPEAPAETSKA